jgi:hypothetical protein
MTAWFSTRKETASNSPSSASYEQSERKSQLGPLNTQGTVVTSAVPALGEPAGVEGDDLVKAVRKVSDETVEITFADQAYTGADAAKAAETEGVRLEVVKHAEVKRGFVLPPRRRVVNRRK